MAENKLVDTAVAIVEGTGIVVIAGAAFAVAAVAVQFFVALI